MTSVFLSKPAVFCCCANNADELWQSVIKGNQSGIKKVTALNGKDFFAARIDNTLLQEKSTARLDMKILRIEEKCLLQLENEITDSLKHFGTTRIGICVGSCDNGTEFSIAGHRKYFANGFFAPEYTLEMQSADYVSTFIKEKYNLQGPCLTFSTACSSSAEAIIKGAQLIQSGICDAVIAGGVDIASDTTLLGFDSLEAVSSQITNPFSKNRHGITLGDAAAFFVLSKEDFSGTGIKLFGYGQSADAYHMTSPDPNGSGAKRAMQEALKRASLKPTDISYLNLHGTGTKFNDSMESKAVNEVFGEYKVPCSTTKPLTGHTLGAAGALEAAICWLTIANNAGHSFQMKNGEQTPSLPVQVWDGEQDPEMPELNIVGNNGGGRVGSEADCIETTKPFVCMSNSFAFGGSNASLIIGSIGSTEVISAK